MILSQLEEGLKVVDKASLASDRWLFLAVLVIMGISVSLAVRWLVSGLRQKDIDHETAMKFMRDGHATERQEWRVVMETSKAEFLAALLSQRADFRAELALERKHFAEERILDRESRHATDNAVQAVAFALAERKETLIHPPKT